jgi:succinoglycan biosynthesis transport protein ExoP
MTSGHDIADAIFRRKAFLLISSLLLLLAVGAAWHFSGGKYESQMVLLVRANRAEIVVTPGQTLDNTKPAGLNEGQIATEVQLITSRGSLRQVVERCKLAEPGADTDRAVEALAREIKVSPMPKASMIEVRYSNTDPKKAAEVLREILAAYTDQHLRVHKGAGTDFFQQQSGDQGARLRTAQQRLTAFQKDTKIVLLAEQKDLNLRRLMELEASERESKVAFQEGKQRIVALKQMVGSLSPRITTQVRKMPNNFLVERLNTMLVELENKRTDLLSKFRADDRLVKQVEQQIADTRVTLDRATRTEATEQASDVNPLRQSLDGDLARARMAQGVLTARIGALGPQIKEYRTEIAKLEQSTAAYTDLVREVKTLEENYQLYSRKYEESRIADALDRQKIANITVVEQPEVPSAPVQRSAILPIGTVLLGLCLIFFAAVLTGLHGQDLHTPQAIFEASGIQVLATLPEMRKTR